jgi:thiol-disulfide isomerase/thioredoxin
MAETPSNMIPLGTKAPDFALFDTCSNKKVALKELKFDKAIVIMFICNHCPYVKHIQSKLVELVKHYQSKGIAFIAINSNDAHAYPADGPDKMHEEAKKHHYTFPYLFDETQSVAKAYRAACTPDFFIFDKDFSCVYRGRFDPSTPGNNYPVSGDDLRQALDHMIAGQAVNADQKASLGCNIKWKKN